MTPSKESAGEAADNLEAMRLAPSQSASEIKTAEEVRQGHVGDGLRRILVASSIFGALALAAALLLFAT